MQTGYIDINGLLVPVRRVSKDDGSKIDECNVEDVALATAAASKWEKTEIFAPDTVDSLALRIRQAVSSHCIMPPVNVIEVSESASLSQTVNAAWALQN